MNWAPIVLTLKLAGLTAAILLVIGMPIAYWLTYSRWRWKFLIGSVVALPFVLPPTGLGFLILVALGPKSPLGQAFQLLVGHPMVFTFAGVLFALGFFSLPFVVLTFQH